MNREQARNGLRLFWDKAEELLRHSSLVLKFLDQALRKAKENSGALRRVGDDFKTLCRMIRASALREYTDVPWRSLVMAVAAIIYFVNPFDFIPDFFLGGYLDDVTVLSYVIAVLKTELDQFKKWEGGEGG